MDGVAVPLGTADGRARIMDRFTNGTLPAEGGVRATSPLGAARICPLLSQSATCAETGAPSGSLDTDQEEVVLGQLWFQLALPERQRFGSCFSRIVLKALSGHSEQQGEERS